MKKSKRYLKFLLILIAISMVMGTAYAFAAYSSNIFYYITNRGAATDFRVSIDKTVSATELRGCTADVGVNLDYAEFSISGAGETDHVYYEIVLEEEETSNIGSGGDCIMLYLTDDEENGITPILSYDLLPNSEYVNGKVLTYDYFDKALNKTFRLRTWVDADCYRILDGVRFDYTIKFHAQK